MSARKVSWRFYCGLLPLGQWEGTVHKIQPASVQVLHERIAVECQRITQDMVQKSLQILRSPIPDTGLKKGMERTEM